VFFQKRLGLSATGARRLLQKFDFCLHHNILSLKNGNAGKPPTQGTPRRSIHAPYCMDFAPKNEMNWKSGSVSICEQSRPLRPENRGTERPLQNRSALQLLL